MKPVRASSLLAGAAARSGCVLCQVLAEIPPRGRDGTIPVTHGINHDELQPVAIHGVVERIATCRVGRFEHASDRRSGRLTGQRWQQIRLHLRRGRESTNSPRPQDEVRVATLGDQSRSIGTLVAALTKSPAARATSGSRRPLLSPPATVTARPSAHTGPCRTARHRTHRTAPVIDPCAACRDDGSAEAPSSDVHPQRSSRRWSTLAHVADRIASAARSARQ